MSAAWKVQYDGIHFFFDHGDGKTVTHVLKPVADLFAEIAAADATLAVAKPKQKT